MVVDRNVFDASLFHFLPEHAVELAVGRRMCAPSPCSGHVLVWRYRIGNLRQDFRKIAAYRYHDTFADGIVRAVSLGFVHHRLGTVSMTRFACVGTIPVEHGTAVPAAFEKVDTQTSGILAVRKIRNRETLQDFRFGSDAGRDFGNFPGRGVQIHNKRLSALHLCYLEVLSLILLDRSSTEHGQKIALLRRLRDWNYSFFASRERKSAVAGIDTLNCALERFDVALGARLHGNGPFELFLEDCKIVEMDMEVTLLGAAFETEAGEPSAFELRLLLLREEVVELMPIGPCQIKEAEARFFSVGKGKTCIERSIRDAEVGICSVSPMITLHPYVHSVEIVRQRNGSRWTQHDNRLLPAPAI